MARCMFPYATKDKFTGKTISCPCGKCPNCKRRGIQGWVHRLLQEDKRCISAYFLTLTYDTEHVPLTKNGFMSLQKTDVQGFIKRLRTYEDRTICKAHGCIVRKNSIKHKCQKAERHKITYYAAGEYGGQRKRPHYHLIIFNIQNDENILKAWPNGNFRADPVTGASIAYCLKYLDKPSIIPQFNKDDRQKEFSLQSKGIGINYITDKNINWHNRNIHERAYVYHAGYKVSMPRYYKEKLYPEEVRKAIGKKATIAEDKRYKQLLSQFKVTKPEWLHFHQMLEADRAKLRKFNNNHHNDKF